MKELPTNVSESTRKRNPHLYGPDAKGFQQLLKDSAVAMAYEHPEIVAAIIPKSTKALLNKTESRWKAEMIRRGMKAEQIMEQAITLRLDPPYQRYTADLAYLIHGFELCLVEVKGPHRFRRAGIAKAALAAKTYPQFRFELKDWDGKQWKESVLSP